MTPSLGISMNKLYEKYNTLATSIKYQKYWRDADSGWTYQNWKEIMEGQIQIKPEFGKLYSYILYLT